MCGTALGFVGIRSMPEGDLWDDKMHKLYRTEVSLCVFYFELEKRHRERWYEKGAFMGYPYFNPPGTQKVNTIEQGHYFVPTAGVEPASVNEVTNLRRWKIKRVVKMGVLVFALVTFAVLACWAMMNAL